MPSTILPGWAERCGTMVLAGTFALMSATVSAEPISPERMASLDHLLHQDCGSCHGMTLQGGLGPALLPERFTDWDIESIADMILYGNPEKAMPPWEGLLSQADARYLAERIKSKGPNR